MFKNSYQPSVLYKFHSFFFRTHLIAEAAKTWPLDPTDKTTTDATTTIRSGTKII